MATNNAINTSLSGQTGSSLNVMSDSPTLTGDIDCSSALVEIPNSSSPSITQSGHIALDTVITDFKPMIEYHDGVKNMVTPGINVSDLSTVDGDILTYKSSTQKFVMAAPLAYPNKILQSNVGFFSSTTTTTSTSPVATTISVSITPNAASNIILVEAYGTLEAEKTGGGNLTERYATITLRRTTPSASNVASFNFGRVFPSSASNSPSFSPLYFMYRDLAISTAVHTYEIYFSVPNSSITVSIDGNQGDCKIMVFELEV